MAYVLKVEDLKASLKCLEEALKIYPGRTDKQYRMYPESIKKGPVWDPFFIDSSFGVESPVVVCRDTIC